MLWNRKILATVQIRQPLRTNYHVSVYSTAEQLLRVAIVIHQSEEKQKTANWNCSFCSTKLRYEKGAVDGDFICGLCCIVSWQGISDKSDLLQLPKNKAIPEFPARPFYSMFVPFLVIYYDSFLPVWLHCKPDHTVSCCPTKCCRPKCK